MGKVRILVPFGMIWPLTWDLSDVNLFAETPIISAEVTCNVPSLVIGAEVINEDGNMVQVVTSGWISGTLYILTCVPETSEGYQRPFVFEAYCK